MTATFQVGVCYRYLLETAECLRQMETADESQMNGKKSF